ncbi:MAG: YtxH domain-containing protein [Elusimicrobiaceae bacterium]|jgi:gas vesicle protein
MKEDNSSSVIAAFVLGGIVGAVAGLLLAPKSGKETREDLGNWLDDAVSKGKDTMHVVGGKLRDHMDVMGDEIRSAKLKISKAFANEGTSMPKPPAGIENVAANIDKIEGSM